MKPKWIALCAAIALVAALVCLGSAGIGAAAPAEPLLSIMPHITFSPLILMFVNVPDAALNQALHAKTGVPMSDALTVADLASITGTLDLSGKGISNPEGLQYCTNISNLFLTNNNLATLPEHFENLTKLRIIILERNDFTDFPASLLLMPDLEEIRFADNELGLLPSNIDDIEKLWMLDVSKNKLTALPASLWKLSKLKSLYCAHNKIEKLSKELFKTPLLDMLDASDNKITEIPSEVKTAPKLKTLALQFNAIAKLPSGIGNAPKLQNLYLGYNDLSTVEASLYGGNIKQLWLTGNRIKSLPGGMEGKSFSALLIEWNFLDVTPGSADNAILDSLAVSGSMAYERQLSRVDITSASATADSVKLKWKPLSGGTSGGSSWDIDKFEVYDATQSPAKLLKSLSKDSAGTTLGEMEPSTEYNLLVRVIYELNDGGYVSHTSCDTYKEAATEAAGSTSTAEPDETEQATQEPASEPEPTAVAETATAAPASADTTGGGDAALLVALVVVGGVVALALVVLIVVLLRKPRTIRIRR